MKILDVTYIVEAISSAASMGLHSLIIEPTGIRGIDENRTVVLFQPGKLPFGTISFDGVKYLSKRLKVFDRIDEISTEVESIRYSITDIATQADFAKKLGVSFDISDFSDKADARAQLGESIVERIALCKQEAKTLKSQSIKSDDEKIISISQTIDELNVIYANNDKLEDYDLIHFSVGNLTLSQRCGDPEFIRAPTKINDSPKYLIDIKRAQVLSLQKICQAVKTEYFVFRASKDGVFLNVLDDISCTEFNIKVGEAEDNINFEHIYPSKLFVQLIKSDKSITVGEKGVLTASLGGFDFHILPLIEDYSQ